jgi:hypothetical protein
VTHRSRERRRQLAYRLRQARRFAAEVWAARPLVLADLPDVSLTLRNLRRRAGELWHLYRPRHTLTPAHLIRDLQRQNGDLTDLLAERDKEVACLAAVNKALHECLDNAFKAGYGVGLDNGLGVGWVNGQKFKLEVDQLGPEGYAG